ncbi:SDR family NAD(P)-dependent oxidoreductase, partial [Amycolatopsis anabasis]|uniref:SDR family NAD(P)-dependent oxidoreductase n=1 Tax=Amycolatopsis anabasis TaxID=1840409 RepID=UPI00131E6E7D
MSSGLDTSLNGSRDLRDPDLPSLPDGVHLYDEEWVPAPLTDTGCAGAIVVFMRDLDEAARVRSAASGTGCGCAVVVAGLAADFRWAGVGEFEVSDAADVARCLDIVAEQHGGVAAVVVDPGATEESVDPKLSLAVVEGITLADVDVRRLVLTPGFATPVERVYGEAWIGFGRSLRLALPLAVTSVALVDRAVAGSPQQWWATIHPELSVTERVDVLLDATGRQRLTNRPVELTAESETNRERPFLRSGGRYLVTGGAGGIGRLLVERLCRAWGAKVIVTGRSELRGDRAALFDDLERVAAEHDAAVHYVRADVLDHAEMAAAVAEADARFGGLDGVFHVAGVGSVGSVVGKG